MTTATPLNVEALRKDFPLLSRSVHDKPIVLLDRWGHYDGLWTWLYGLVDSGYITQAAMERLVVVDKVSAALEACAPA